LPIVYLSASYLRLPVISVRKLYFSAILPMFTREAGQDNDIV
jgi:hypothetical protein